jgi:hypothetical protein
MLLFGNLTSRLILTASAKFSKVRPEEQGLEQSTDPGGQDQSRLLAILGTEGIMAWNNPTGAVRVAPDRWLHFGKKGSADIIGLLPGGKFLAVETKAPAGRLSPEQREFLADVKALGGMAIVARSCRDIETALMEAGYVGIVAEPLFEGGEHGQNQ